MKKNEHNSLIDEELAKVRDAVAEFARAQQVRCAQLAEAFRPYVDTDAAACGIADMVLNRRGFIVVNSGTSGESAKQIEAAFGLVVIGLQSVPVGVMQFHKSWEQPAWPFRQL